VEIVTEEIKEVRNGKHYSLLFCLQKEAEVTGVETSCAGARVPVIIVY
jgi:hypothetical protein